MATMTAPAAVGSAEGIADTTRRPSFAGMVGGELFKLSRQRLNWLLLLMLAGATSIYYLFALGSQGIKNDLLADSPTVYFSLMTRELAIIRMFIGLFLMVATARMIGLEYQQGTIRVLLARGTGRIQLLGAKLLAMAITALVVFAGCLLLAATLAVALTAVLAGNLTPLQALSTEFWRDAGLYLVTVLISMGVTILMATAVTTVSRSLSFGLGASIGYFAADNFLVPILGLVAVATGNTFWTNLTGYFLGPELNGMPSLLVPRFQGQKPTTVGFEPYVHYDATHALLVALAYSVVFLAAALVVTWRKDVLE